MTTFLTKLTIRFRYTHAAKGMILERNSYRSFTGIWWAHSDHSIPLVPGLSDPGILLHLSGSTFSQGVQIVLFQRERQNNWMLKCRTSHYFEIKWKRISSLNQSVRFVLREWERRPPPGHREHLWECSWPHWSPCWPGQTTPPWKPAPRTSSCPCRFPVRQITPVDKWLRIIN